MGFSAHPRADYSFGRYTWSGKTQFPKQLKVVSEGRSHFATEDGVLRQFYAPEQHVNDFNDGDVVYCGDSQEHIDLITAWLKREFGLTAESEAPPEAPVLTQEPCNFPVHPDLAIGQQGGAVGHLQELVGLEINNIFDQKTADAIGSTFVNQEIWNKLHK